MKKPIILALAISAVLSLIAVAQPATASHSWGTYHWGRTSNPFSLKTGDNVTSVWDSYLNVAISDWSQSTKLDMVKVAGGAGNVKRCTSASGRVEVCNASYGFNGWLGIAGISLSGGHIVSGYVKLNDSYFNTATYNTPEYRQYVTCQELGHVLGLGHTDENFDNPNQGTCMDYTNSPGTNQRPNQHDYDQLNSIYAHTDSVNTWSFAAAPLPNTSDIMTVDVDAAGNGTVTWILPVQ